MADSLNEACTPLKRAYDSCFNTWFEGYLEPAVAATSEAQREAYSKEKAEEFKAKCGKMWIEYKTCVQNSLKDKGLVPLLEQAREEHPMKEAPPPLSTD
ncbi:mitochondrial distribution/morphology family 35/apoptosis [Mucidula mucida]|nr:mitochondrial distribution/morphology family 35/apoptosis [Mucidula mucida]